MHVVDTTVFFSPTSGGVRRYLTAKHEWYATRGPCRHTLLVPGEVERFEPGGLTTLRGTRVPGTFNYRLPLDPQRWSSLLEALEPDLIEVGDAFHPAWCAAQVAQRRGIPLVAFFHSNLPELVRRRMGGAIGGGFARYVRWLYRRFDAVLAPSRFMRDYLHSLGVTRVHCQPLGVDTDVFNPAQRVLDVRRELGLPAKARVLVFAGRFSGEKNLPVLFDAFARLGDPYHLLLIGGGEAKQHARNVTAIPYRRDVGELARWIASADALVHAGTRETFGLVIIEALACGRPVIGTRAGAVPELVDESVGQLAVPHDAASFADAIASLYDRDTEALGRAARERALRYSWGHTFQAQLNTYVTLGARLALPLATARPPHATSA
ncbi:MAG: glycosyltransferase family 1 protein [Steroidobacteraceae bacterium]|nr:glycosyltransferase family 1 protein [Steroidobacteraceae bacterium]